MVRGTHNLKRYVQAALLPRMINGRDAPPMPPEGHRSHRNNLAVRPETWRRLENIYSLDNFDFENVVSSWIDMFFPFEPLRMDDMDEDNGDTLSIPCPGTNFDITYREERKPSNLQRIAPWVDNLALMTVQRIMHLLYPGSHPFTFTLADDRDDDRPIFQHYLWSIPEHILEGLPEENRRQVQFSSVIVAFQPPWVLSTQDIKEFSKCRSFPPFIEPGHAFPTSLDSTHRLWAKLWDLCVRKNTPWFVLTSYNHWTFGMFSKGWTSAFVSGVYEYNHHHPTITECLTYWIASAMRLATTLRCPKVPEPVHLPPIQIIARSRADISDPEMSESNWDGKSEEAGSVARGIYNSDRELSPPVTDAGLSNEGPTAPVHRSKLYLEHVQKWMNETIDSNDIEPIDPDPNQQIVDDDMFLYTSQTTFNDGEWLVPN